MSEPDPVIARLAKLAPAPADRDAVLFAAGKASARTPWAWRFGTLVLAISQIVTLVLWRFDRPAPLTSPPPTPAPTVAPAEPASPPPPEAGSYLALMRAWDGDRLPPVSATAPAGPADPPLTAAAGRRGDL